MIFCWVFFFYFLFHLKSTNDQLKFWPSSTRSHANYFILSSCYEIRAKWKSLLQLFFHSDFLFVFGFSKYPVFLSFISNKQLNPLVSNTSASLHQYWSPAWFSPRESHYVFSVFLWVFWVVYIEDCLILWAGGEHDSWTLANQVKNN